VGRETKSERELQTVSLTGQLVYDNVTIANDSLICSVCNCGTQFGKVRSTLVSSHSHSDEL